MTGVAGAASSAVRAFAFAEPGAGGSWGAAWLPPGAPPAGVLAFGDQTSAQPLQLEGTGVAESWRLTADPEMELVLEGLGEPGWSNPETPADGFQQLCRVTGTVDASHGGGRLECLGWRSVGGHAIDPALNSFRLVAGWFDDQNGFALVAGRPRRSKGQDADLVTAALFDPAGARVVADPRLSTTYAESGRPTRAGVELWIEADADPDQLYPRRAVGEAMTSPVQWRVADMAVEAQAFQWFSGGRQGAGAYLLVQW
jgi:hypothetical protein